MKNERLTLTVVEAAKMLGISRGLAYEMVRTGEIPSIRFGKRILVPQRALELLLERHEKNKSKEADAGISSTDDLTELCNWR